MGLDFDIITDSGKIIDRYSIKWLYRYNYKSYFTSIIEAILYCDEQIEELEKELEELEELEFEKELTTRFKSFKLFLQKYQGYKFDISC
jgi:hypothetical protein